jgi:Leucine-rich repeat (LRR) protein
VAPRRLIRRILKPGLGTTPMQHRRDRYLTALTGLWLHGNQLSALPEGIGNLTALTELNLSGNQLTALPEGIGNLTALTTLERYGNKLAAIPEYISNLTAPQACSSPVSPLFWTSADDGER